MRPGPRVGGVDVEDLSRKAAASGVAEAAVKEASEISDEAGRGLAVVAAVALRKLLATVPREAKIATVLGIGGFAIVKVGQLVKGQQQQRQLRAMRRTGAFQ